MSGLRISRRQFVVFGLAATALGSGAARAVEMPPGWVLPEEYRPKYVKLAEELPPGEIHVDPNTFSLYLTQPEQKAIRYIVGVGRGNLYEPGEFSIGAKKEWPSWTPTQEMIDRSPERYAQYADGMPGGPTNPLGARAIYLFAPNIGDTFLRIHGTPEPWTIASAVSNGCVRLVNEHVAHLYENVQLGARVVLYPKVTA